MLLLVDGLQGGDAGSKWDSTSSGSRATATPRFAGGAYLDGPCSLRKSFTAVSEVFLAAAFYFPGSTLGENFVIFGDSGATMHLTVLRNASGFMEVHRGPYNGTLLATGTTNIPTGWVQVQVRATISDTVGICQVKVNGQSGLDINYSGDTKNGGTATTIDKVWFGQSTSGYFVTDAVLLNTAGSVNNTWPGDRRVLVLAPTGNGYSSQGDGSDGDSVDNYLLVDESPFSDTDYVSFSGSGAKTDAFTFSDLPYGTAEVGALQLNPRLAKDPGTRTYKRLIRSAGTNYLGSALTGPASFLTVPDVVELNPATSAAWTPDEVDGFEAGLQIQSGTPAYYVTGFSVEALIDSVPAVNLVKVNGGGTITVDFPNDVQVDGGGTIVVLLASESAGLVTVNGGGTPVVVELITDYPRAEPADPTLTDPAAGEIAVQLVADVYPDPTLVDGVPVDWEAS